MQNNNFNQKKMMDAAVSSSGGKIDRDSISKAIDNKDAAPLLQKLSAADREKLARVMADKGSMEAILNSPQAKALLKTFLKGGGQNG